MKFGRTLLSFTIAWLVLITLLHGKLNLGWFEARKPGENRTSKFGIGFLPVTCNLTCPVTHFINKEMAGEDMFKPMRFSGWPELKEMFIGRPRGNARHLYSGAHGHRTAGTGGKNQNRLPRPPRRLGRDGSQRQRHF